MSDQPQTCRTGSGGPCCRGNRWFLWIILLLMGGVYLYSTRSRPSAVVWADDLQAAMDTAAQKNRRVLIDFHTAWCGYCKEMDDQVFSRQEVAEALAKWVPVKVDCERYPAVAAKYQVDSYPTFVALSSKGEAIGRLDGAVPAEQFIEWIKSAEQRSSAATKPE